MRQPSVLGHIWILKPNLYNLIFYNSDLARLIEHQLLKQSPGLTHTAYILRVHDSTLLTSALSTVAVISLEYYSNLDSSFFLPRNLYIRHGAQTHDSESKSQTLYQLSQPVRHPMTILFLEAHT